MAWDPRAELERIGSDLLRLEINTIFKPTMSAAAFPHPGHAFLDIARDYEQWLLHGDRKRDVEEAEFANYVDSAGLQFYVKHCSLDGERCVSLAAFRMLRDLAKLLCVKSSTEDTVLFSRIVDNCNTLLGILERRSVTDEVVWTRKNADSVAPVKDLSPADTQLLRKIWDIGLERIAFQTIVHVGGDVFTRISQDRAQDAALLALHHEGVRIAVGWWKNLIRVAAGLFKDLISIATR